MSINKGSNRSKTKSKRSKKAPQAEAPQEPGTFHPGAIELDTGPEPEPGLGGDVKEMLLQQDSLSIDGQELEQVFEDDLGDLQDKEGLLEPGPGEEAEQGSMISQGQGSGGVKVPTKMPPPSAVQKMEKLIACLREYGNPTRAAQAAGITRRKAYHWRQMYPGFAKAWSIAMAMAIDDLEEEARRRAFSGVLKPAGWYKGVAGGRVREYSDNLLMFLLKAYRPDKFKDRIEATGAGVLGVKVQITDYSHSTPEAVETGEKGEQKHLPEGVIDVKDESKGEGAG